MKTSVESDRVKVTGLERDAPLKILIVSDAWYPQVNGVVRTYEYLQQDLRAMGHEVKIIGPADFPRSFPMPGYAEIHLTLHPYHALRRMIDSYGPDLFHIATEGPLGLAARRYATTYGMEFTSCYHTHFPDYAAQRVAKFLPFLFKPVRAIAISFVRWFHKKSSCLFVATQSLEDTLRGWNFICPMKRMTRGIDYTIFYPGPPILLTDLQKPIALYVGRVAVEKNLDSFLSMDWDGSKVIVGTGPDLEFLSKRHPDAQFVGKKTGTELSDHYRSADIFVFPSKTDTFGMVLIEAMACGLPIAAYPVTGPIDIVTEPVLGALDDDLGTAAQNALLQKGNAQARFEHAKANYSWKTAARQFLETD